MAGVECWELDRWSLKIIGNRDCGSAAEPKNCGDETRAGQPHSTLTDHPPQNVLVLTHNMAAIYLPYGAFSSLAASESHKRR